VGPGVQEEVKEVQEVLKGKGLEWSVQELLPEHLYLRAIEVADGLTNDENTRGRSTFEMMLLAYWQGRRDERKESQRT
jgi:hypothetical protein